MLKQRHHRANKRFDADGNELSEHGYWVAERADEFEAELKTKLWDDVYNWWFNKEFPGTHIHDVLVEVGFRGLNPYKVRDMSDAAKTVAKRHGLKIETITVKPTADDLSVVPRLSPSPPVSKLPKVSVQDVRAIDLSIKSKE